MRVLGQKPRKEMIVAWEHSSVKVVRGSWILAQFLEAELTKFTEGLDCGT